MGEDTLEVNFNGADQVIVDLGREVSPDYLELSGRLTSDAKTAIREFALRITSAVAQRPNQPVQEVVLDPSDSANNLIARFIGQEETVRGAIPDEIAFFLSADLIMHRSTLSRPQLLGLIEQGLLSEEDVDEIISSVDAHITGQALKCVSPWLFHTFTEIIDTYSKSGFSNDTEFADAARRDALVIVKERVEQYVKTGEYSQIEDLVRAASNEKVAAENEFTQIMEDAKSQAIQDIGSIIGEGKTDLAFHRIFNAQRVMFFSEGLSEEGNLVVEFLRPKIFEGVAHLLSIGRHGEIGHLLNEAYLERILVASDREVVNEKVDELVLSVAEEMIEAGHLSDLKGLLSVLSGQRIIGSVYVRIIDRIKNDAMKLKRQGKIEEAMQLLGSAVRNDFIQQRELEDIMY